ncbi:hypothetical protein ACJMK2_033896 [Sinanodonta woodiana]|uniref:Protein kinase domain-containing protein n=1 Tax=Sinanodonta woodiana TaxID=1069815 RepID=A0ABD3WTD1_SINWO
MVQFIDGRTRFDILKAEKQPRFISLRYPSLRIFTELFTKSRGCNSFNNNTFNNKYRVLERYDSHIERGTSFQDSLEQANIIGVKQHVIPAASTLHQKRLHSSVLANHIHNNYARQMIYNNVPIVYGVNVLSETQKRKQDVDLWFEKGGSILDNSLRCFRELVSSHSVHTPFVLSTRRKDYNLLHAYINVSRESEFTSLVNRVKGGKLGTNISYKEALDCDYINLPTYLLFGPTLQRMNRSLCLHYGTNKSAIYLVTEKSSPRLQRRSSSKSRRDDINHQIKSQTRETFSGFRIFVEDSSRNSNCSCRSTVIPKNHSSDNDFQTNEIVQSVTNLITEKSTDDCNSVGFHSASIHSNQENKGGERNIEANDLELGCVETMHHYRKYPKYENILNTTCTKIDKLLYALGYSSSYSYEPSSNILCYQCSSREACSMSLHETEALINIENIFENREGDRNDSNSNYTKERQDIHSGEIKALPYKVFPCPEKSKLSSDVGNGDTTSLLQTCDSGIEYKRLDKVDKVSRKCKCCSFCPGSSWRSLNYSSSGFITTDLGGYSFYFGNDDNDVLAGNESEISFWKPLAETNSPTEYACISTSCTSGSDDDDIRCSIKSSSSFRKDSLSINSEIKLDRVISFYISSGDEERSKSSDEISVSADVSHPAKCVLQKNLASPCMCNNRINEDVQIYVENSTPVKKENWSKFSGTDKGRKTYLQTSNAEKGASQTINANIIHANDDVIESNYLNVCINVDESHEGSDQKMLCQETRVNQKYNHLPITKSAPVNVSLPDGTIIRRDVGTKIETVITKRNDSVRKYVDWLKGDFCCPWSSKKYSCYNYHSDVSNRSKVLIDVQRHDTNHNIYAINTVNKETPDVGTDGMVMEDEFHNIGIPELSVRSVCFLPDEYGSERILGKGTYGTAYVAEMTVSGRLVVVKEFESEFQVEAEVLKEARILLHLEDTGFVPKLFGLIRGESLSLVQEFAANGVTLHSLIKGNYTRLPSQRWISICRQMALGLKAIHSKDILHNDIKTDNIIVDFLKKDTPIKYIDFGLSTYHKGFKFCAPNGYLKHYEYLAPEVCRSQHTTVKSEIYSLGYCYKKIAEKAVPLLLFLSNDCMNFCPEKRPTVDIVISKIQGLQSKTKHFKASSKHQRDKSYK